jgi:hypothetical protein
MLTFTCQTENWTILMNNRKLTMMGILPDSWRFKSHLELENWSSVSIESSVFQGCKESNNTNAL